MTSFRAQGAFEYMLSYGWAILIVIVLGILLFSLGVFNPTQAPSATGFAILKPVSWSFSGGDPDSTNVTLALENVAGQSLTLYVTDNSTKKSIKFKKGNSGECYFNASSTTVTDSGGNTLTITNTKVPVPIGGVITITGTVDGNGRAQSGAACGGLINGGYRYDVQIVVEDEYQVIKKDSGVISGKYI